MGVSYKGGAQSYHGIIDNLNVLKVRLNIRMDILVIKGLVVEFELFMEMIR